MSFMTQDNVAGRKIYVVKKISNDRSNVTECIIKRQITENRSELFFAIEEFI